VNEQGACVVSVDIVTVDNMRQTPTFVQKIRDENHRQALDDLRPRFAPIAQQQAAPSAIAPVLAGVIRDASTSRSTIVPGSVDVAIVDRGRVVIANSNTHSNWKTGTAVAFSIHSNLITATACATEDENATIVDVKGRVLLPLAARKRMNFIDGERVFVVSVVSPAPHVLFIPVAFAIDRLLSEENK
jgi:hypothetical protein